MKSEASIDMSAQTTTVLEGRSFIPPILRILLTKPRIPSCTIHSFLPVQLVVSKTRHQLTIPNNPQQPNSFHTPSLELTPHASRRIPSEVTHRSSLPLLLQIASTESVPSPLLCTLRSLKNLGSCRIPAGRNCILFIHK